MTKNPIGTVNNEEHNYINNYKSKEINTRWNKRKFQIF